MAVTTLCALAGARRRWARTTSGVGVGTGSRVHDTAPDWSGPTFWSPRVCLRSVAMNVGDLFEAEFERLVRALGVAFSPEAAADAVQEAFIRADRHWHRVGRLDDPAG